MRAAIAALGDGRYEAEARCDGYGEEVVLRVAATIAGDEITLDFAGSSPQSRHGINVVLNYTHAYASFALKAAIAPAVPHNDGSFAPVHVLAPEGSILSCVPPAPVASRHVVGHFVPGLVTAALAPVLGGRAPARGADPIWISVWSSPPETPARDAYSLTLFQAGGMGAWHGRDGRSATGYPSAVAYVPTEILEQSTPLVQRERALRPGSGGPGRWRGGLGQTSALTLRPGAAWRMSALVDRTMVAAPGAEGGHEGAPGLLRSGDEPLAPKRLIDLAPDAVVRFDLPGGGGVGDPLERDPEAVLGDVLDGYVSLDEARTQYGVAVRRTAGRPDARRVLLPGDLEVDHAATAALRAAQAPAGSVS
jgi:N-methylhydantoinase B